MSVHKFTVAFTHTSNVPADNLVNTWYFEGGGSDPENVADMLTDFYDAVPAGGTDSVSDYLSNSVLTGEYRIKAYDLSDPEPRAPVYEDVRNLIELQTAAALPDEVALVFSYHAQLASGVPQARRRGRIYLGGIVAQQNDVGRPASNIRNVLVRAGRDLIQASNASTSWEWQQYSTLLGVGNIVVGGWVDNAWDTQRRRGRAATSRVLFTGGTP